MGPLTDFWRQREEAEFTGVDNVPVRFVRFCASHDRVVVICPGRIESYVKYAELAYDLFRSGFDVMIIDHRGQGRSGRMLSDTHRGQSLISAITSTISPRSGSSRLPGRWRKRFILAHSMGGAIATLFLQRYHQHCDAMALCAPMFGIVMRLPSGWCAIFSIGLRAISAFVKGMPSVPAAGGRCPLRLTY
ncbi:alpha/beta fold hydrolase [Escherichia coli]